MHEEILSGIALTDLRSEHRGPVLVLGDPGYDEARRVWNGMHDRRPALIARCLTASDVSAVLRHAVAADVPVTVRGGGHNVAGTAVSDDSVMIDLSLMRAVTVDPAAEQAEAEGGCLLGEVDAATAPYGLACPAGVVSHTGLGGLALGGGYGWLARKWGLTCDHILAAEVVLPDGSVVEVSESQHPELLWALRGGGGNFGIVTRFTLRLRPVGPVYHHAAVFGPNEAPAALEQYRRFAAGQSSDMHAVGAFKVAGQQEWIPERLRGEPALFLTAVWLGDPADGPAAVAPLFGTVEPAGSVARVMPYLELQGLGDHGEPHGNRYFTKSCYLSDLASDPVAELVEAARDIRSPLSSIDFEFLCGAISGPANEDSAFPRREAPYICTASAQWIDPQHDAENIAWTRNTVARLAAWTYGGAYVNYLQDEPADRVVEVYGEARYRRLAAVKNSYDPRNVLRSNQNIRPTSGTAHLPSER
ncbi:FAD-binding oxidoreductase [Kitasatospora sp. CB02891]|uniref:FAD-binding oxidoreductase n=1 Tax=Kitasatospora sp. CB02891 TaxID=2020329 RepID=UPI0018E1DD86|nr:FAD-binding oxidoreductase [Kitasatospora sp. CB02891]